MGQKETLDERLAERSRGKIKHDLVKELVFILKAIGSL